MKKKEIWECIKMWPDYHPKSIYKKHNYIGSGEKVEIDKISSGINGKNSYIFFHSLTRKCSTIFPEFLKHFKKVYKKGENGK